MLITIIFYVPKCLVKLRYYNDCYCIGALYIHTVHCAIQWMQYRRRCIYIYTYIRGPVSIHLSNYLPNVYLYLYIYILCIVGICTYNNFYITEIQRHIRTCTYRQMCIGIVYLQIRF